MFFYFILDKFKTLNISILKLIFKFKLQMSSVHFGKTLHLNSDIVINEMWVWSKRHQKLSPVFPYCRCRKAPYGYMSFKQTPCKRPSKYAVLTCSFLITEIDLLKQTIAVCVSPGNYIWVLSLVWESPWRYVLWCQLLAARPHHRLSLRLCTRK